MKPIETAKHVISAPILAPPRVGSSLQGSSRRVTRRHWPKPWSPITANTPICPSGANKRECAAFYVPGPLSDLERKTSSPWCWP